MFVQTEITPNPNSLKFLPGKKVSSIGPVEINDIEKMNDFKLESNGHQNGNGTLDSEGGVVTEESIQRTIDSLEVFF